MKKTIQLLIPVLALVLMAGQANAFVWMDVTWGASQSITFNLVGYGSNKSVNIGPAAGRYAATQAGLTTAGTAQYFCVDVTKGASSGTDYKVDLHETGETTPGAGWITPTTDLDNLRSAPGLFRAAALVNRFGSSFSTDALAVKQGTGILNTNNTDKHKRTVALNVAIWNAAYGADFTYVSGLAGLATTVGTELYYYTQYLNYYNTGASSTNYRWFDHASGDGPSNAQDFITGVPEPSSLILLGSVLTAIAGFVAIRRKRSA